jgi:hypothetical protein
LVPIAYNPINPRRAVFMLHLFLHTDLGLLIRILVGCAIFAVLALLDLRRNGPSATRWREYGVLVISVLTALLYGAINDQITVTISPEYFLYGKELEKIVGEHPAQLALRFQAALVGLKATWSVGLICGVVLLIANNPWRSLPRLRNRQLLVHLPIIVLVASLCGLVGGCLGYCGYLTRLDSDFGDLLAVNLYRPYRFMAAWGVHLGGYLGGALGTLTGVAAIVLRRLVIANGRAGASSPR